MFTYRPNTAHLPHPEVSHLVLWGLGLRLFLEDIYKVKMKTAKLI
jgi:hypothetical protein